MPALHRSLLVRQVLPALGLFLGLVAVGLGLDYALHRAGLAWVGRYLGPVGTLLLLLSLLYSLRKRKLIRHPSPRRLLELHESLAWAGALCLLLHSGIHFHAVLPWLALSAMLIVVASGLTGAVLLREAVADLAAREGTAPADPDTRLLDAATVDLMRRWRVVHMPLNAAFAALGLVHVVTILVFGEP